MKVSRLVLGTVQFGMNYGVANTHGKPSYETVKDILRKALDNGITTLDTAAGYGDSEEVIGVSAVFFTFGLCVLMFFRAAA